MYRIRGLAGHFFMKLCGLFPITNKAVFMSFYGKSYSDNPKAIYEQMIRENIEMEYVWLMNDSNVQIAGATVIKTPSFHALFHLATAKLWVDTSRTSAWVVKRKGQYYVQTWHAGITMKKVEQDASEKLSEDYIKGAKHDSQMADLFISGSKWNSDNYRKSFWYKGEILESGLPRSDIFFEKNRETLKKIKSKYQIQPDQKIALYAPTFRVDGQTECYNIAFLSVLRALERRWGGTWCVLVKLHPNVQAKRGSIQYQQNVKDASVNSDINELLTACEVLITDYSSCMFDALNLGKKVFLYAADIETYYQDRGTYFTFQELPFPLAQSNHELIESIITFDEDEYREKISSFKDAYKIFDDGHASERVANQIRGILCREK